MDLLLPVAAFALAIVILILPHNAGVSQLLQILLAVLLGALALVRFLQRRPPAQRETAELPRQEAKPAPVAAAPAPETLVEAGVVQFLGRLQEKGRLVDFCMEDITPYSNEDIGVVARVVHQGCREVLQDAFKMEPVHPGKEQEEISLAGDFDAVSYRLVGKVPDRPPYRGTVLHLGWKATRVTLPRPADIPPESVARKIIAPAEIEIG